MPYKHTLPQFLNRKVTYIGDFSHFTDKNTPISEKFEKRGKEIASLYCKNKLSVFVKFKYPNELRSNYPKKNQRKQSKENKGQNPRSEKEPMIWYPN